MSRSWWCEAGDRQPLGTGMCVNAVRGSEQGGVAFTTTPAQPLRTPSTHSPRVAPNCKRTTHGAQSHAYALRMPPTHATALQARHA
eukprot:358288-Chlamydomonas_euryale.AAC.5